MVDERGYSSITRRSLIESPEFKKQAARSTATTSPRSISTRSRYRRSGYMKYRTVPVYPQVDKQIDMAIRTSRRGQMSAKEAMQQAQQNSLAELKRAGIKL